MSLIFDFDKTFHQEQQCSRDVTESTMENASFASLDEDDLASFTAQQDGDFELWNVDQEEQRAALERYESARSCLSESSRSNTSFLNNEESIEVYPGYSLPLKGTEETWAAINNGYFNITQCIGCQEDLGCVVKASFVVCSCCTTISPVESDKSPMDLSNHTTTSTTTELVGMGIKTSDIQDHFKNEI